MCTYLVHITHRIHIVQWVGTYWIDGRVCDVHSEQNIYTFAFVSTSSHIQSECVDVVFCSLFFLFVHLIHFLGIWKLVEAHTDIQLISMQASSMHPSIHSVYTQHTKLYVFSESSVRWASDMGKRDKYALSLSSVRRMYIHHSESVWKVYTTAHWMVMVNIHIM